MRIAIVHDYLNQQGGAERVVQTLHQIFPNAPVYTLFYEPDRLLPRMKDAKIIPSFLQKYKVIRNNFKLFFWLYPFAVQTLKLENFDVVISSSSAYGKGITLRRTQTGKRPVHVCYCHTPMRFAWSFDNYIENETSNRFLRRVASWLVPFLKHWDVRTARNVSHFIANSTIVANRIKDCYGRDSTVIFPPVEHPSEPVFQQPEDYFLVVSRLVSYKRIDLAVRACTQENLPLVVIGDGPDKLRLQAMAGPSVKFLGYQTEESKRQYMSRCKALIFPGEEDFGITPVEVNGLGRPVVAYKAGGALDTVKDGLNGIFFTKQSVEDLIGALHKVAKQHWDPNKIYQWAIQFGTDIFESRIKDILAECAP